MIISQYEREGSIKICNTVSSLILDVKMLHTTLSLIWYLPDTSNSNAIHRKAYITSILKVYSQVAAFLYTSVVLSLLILHLHWVTHIWPSNANLSL